MVDATAPATLATTVASTDATDHEAKYLTPDELQAGLENIRLSPKDKGVLHLIVRRPQIETRESLQAAQLDLVDGVVGDTWKIRGSSRTADGSSHPDTQLNIMNSRVAALVAQDIARWQLAGDQLYIDLELSYENLPPGTRLSIGTAIIEVTALPHTGCKKFVARFGVEALKFIESPEGKRLNMRGINAKVVQPGVIRVGDVAKKLP